MNLIFLLSYIALKWQLLAQAPHLIHFVSSILYPFSLSPEIAPTGQFLAHSPHLLHFSEFIENPSNALHSFAGHFLSFTCAMYSSLK